MTLCQLTHEMKADIQAKLESIRQQVDAIMTKMGEEEGCLLCEITSVVDLTHELEVLASFYHFQSSLLPHIEGLDEIIKALARLSHNRHGALVAVERSDSLETYINACSITGVPISAVVSAPLIETIFYPGNPLHDGAVLVRKNQIVSAGCLLPLSNRKYNKEGKKIGTRHRAALGLSELTDALVLTVSEETGQVSFALNGILHPIEIKLCSHIDSPLGIETHLSLP